MRPGAKPEGTSAGTASDAEGARLVLALEVKGRMTSKARSDRQHAIERRQEREK
ncbi:hypothetical protein ACPOL_0160 [Acidisarcina polymorpha]|uniref:Uncharacterized protein n=1 Tax=Acidisarcina polymorpha TaxID=2211140 RepID=A0A2Z5FST4_9BACT|nr:hypothetical protein ACPOL_0160 [Acidisarcina polymorpha]